MSTRWKLSWADIKKIFRKSDLGSKIISHVLVVQLDGVFPVDLLVTALVLTYTISQIGQLDQEVI